MTASGADDPGPDDPSPDDPGPDDPGPDDPGPGVLPGMPHDDGGPIFQAPWQAQAFAMTVKLHQQGHFTWKEWAEHLSVEIRRAQAGGDRDLGDTYYHHWLCALEALVARKGLIGEAELNHRRDAWDRAARATPHGQPIVLGREKESAAGS